MIIHIIIKDMKMNFIEIIKAILIGIVEGITEWLPVSSTGHMILFNELWPLNVSKEFMELFLVVIQLGAIMAVVIIFWKKIWPFHASKDEFIDKQKFIMWFKIVVACIPGAVVEILFDDQIDALFYNYLTVAIMLILFGIGFIIIERKNKNKNPQINSIAEITFKTAFYIGIFQLVAAVFPGTSRSGATILGAILIGVSRSVATEFTFFLAIPVMFGASLLKLLKIDFAINSSEIILLATSMITAFIVSIITIKLLVNYIKKNDFTAFGWYRIVLGIVVLLFFGVVK